MMHLLNEREWRFFKDLERRFGGDWLSQVGNVPGEQPAAPPRWDWVQVTGAAATLNSNGDLLYPCRPALRRVKDGRWDLFNTCWAWRPGNLSVASGYHPARQAGLNPDDNLPIFILHPTTTVATGTGTVTTPTTPGCTSYEFQSYRYRCEPTDVELSHGYPTNNLNEYVITTTVVTDDDGCVTVTEGAEVYNRTVGCCDPRCASDIPATGTGTGLMTCPCADQPGFWTLTFTGLVGSCQEFNRTWYPSWTSSCTWQQTVVITTGSYPNTYRVRVRVAAGGYVQADMLIVVGGTEYSYGKYTGTLASATDCCSAVTLHAAELAACTDPSSSPAVVATPNCADPTGTGTHGHSTTGTGTIVTAGTGQVPCCTGAIPHRIHATITNNVGCTCLDGVKVTLTYNGSTGRWEGSAFVPSCTSSNLYMTFACVGTQLGIALKCTTAAAPDLFTSTYTCSPLSVNFTGYSPLTCCPGTCNVAITI